MEKLVVGIDPGKKGAISFLSLDASNLEVYDMPSLFEFVRLVKERKEKILRVFIEKQQAFPGQGVVSTSRLMKHYGELIGSLVALEIAVEEVPPRTWQKEFHYPNKLSKKERKLLSIQKALSLFPHGEIGKKDGRAEAVLIAEFGRRKFTVKSE